LFPIINWLPKYKIKTDLLPDFIAGITISILHIPQGIAYSLLAGLDAVHGLYVSFFPVLIYTLMGTSRHISIGSFAVASLMLSNTATKLGSVPHHIEVFNETTNETLTVDWPPTTLEALTTVCIVTGFIQLLMGFLSLGSLSLILSDHLVSGFSTAVAFHVATSQMNYILGLSIPNQRSGPLKLIKVCNYLIEYLLKMCSSR
jgi:MFS superfamily sulfate permease-like transporter